MADSQNLKDSKQESKAFVTPNKTVKHKLILIVFLFSLKYLIKYIGNNIIAELWK